MKWFSTLNEHLLICGFHRRLEVPFLRKNITLFVSNYRISYEVRLENILCLRGFVTAYTELDGQGNQRLPKSQDIFQNITEEC